MDAMSICLVMLIWINNTLTPNQIEKYIGRIFNLHFRTTPINGTEKKGQHNHKKSRNKCFYSHNIFSNIYINQLSHTVKHASIIIDLVINGLFPIGKYFTYIYIYIYM